MNPRGIETILSPEAFVWVGDGFRTTSFVGKRIARQRMDPFFAVGYSPLTEFEAAVSPKGVSAHPHKGFETVSLAYRGKLEHRDSQGNHGVIGEGDVQWMTAGRGIVHEEFHERSWAARGGVFQMVQLWVNLPAQDKEVEPRYQELRRREGPLVPTDTRGSRLHVIAGTYEGRQGKAMTYSPIHLYHVYLNPSGHAEMSLPRDFNTAMLVIEGEVRVNAQRVVSKDQFVLFENDGGEDIRLETGDAKSLVLLMSGKPLNESLAHAGPFVMNTREQLHRAFEEFQRGQFGTLSV